MLVIIAKYFFEGGSRKRTPNSEAVGIAKKEEEVAYILEVFGIEVDEEFVSTVGS